MLNIKQVWYSEDYNKIRNECENRLAFITFGGSHAYGTNIPTSDIDIRGVALNKREHLLGIQNEEQMIDNKTDSVIYDFNKFINLICNCNPNTIELLGTKPETVLIFNDVGLELIKMAPKFLTKKALYAFGGYATAQLRRLQNAICRDSMAQGEQEVHIKNSMVNAINSFNSRYKCFNKDSIKLFVEDSDKSNLEKEILMNITLANYPLRDFNGIYSELTSILRDYNKLGQRNNKKDEAHLNKHAMHLYRLYLMLFDIIEKQEILTYRENDIPMLMDIRNGKYDLYNKDNKFWKDLTAFENKLDNLKDTCNLPKKINFNEIQDFVISVNERLILGKVNEKIKEPTLYKDIV